MMVPVRVYATYAWRSENHDHFEYTNEAISAAKHTRAVQEGRILGARYTDNGPVWAISVFVKVPVPSHIVHAGAGSVRNYGSVLLGHVFGVPSSSVLVNSVGWDTPLPNDRIPARRPRVIRRVIKRTKDGRPKIAMDRRNSIRLERVVAQKPHYCKSRACSLNGSALIFAGSQYAAVSWGQQIYRGGGSYPVSHKYHFECVPQDAQPLVRLVLGPARKVKDR